MMSNNFQLSQQADPNKLFLTKFSELEGRFDPIFYHITKIKLLAKKTKYLVKKLSDIAFLKRGRFSHRPRNDPDFYGGKYPFIQTGDIVAASEKHGKIQHTQTLNEQGLQTSKLFQADRILITIAANIGDTAILRYPACFPDSIVSITPKDTLLSLEYLHYYLKFTKSYLVDLAPQSAQKNLNLQQLSPTLVVIPPKNIQAEIVAKMDTAYQDKKDKEAQAQNLLDSIDTYLLNELGINLPKPVDNSLKARIFTKKFSDVAGGRLDAEYYQNKYIDFENSLIEKSECIFLKELLQMLESGSRPTGGVGNIESGILSFGATHVSRDGYIDTSKAKYIPIEYHQKNLATATKINDLLLVKDGATTGKIAMIQKPKHENQNINEHVFLMRLKNNVNPIFLLSYLKSSFGNMQIKREITGATVTGLTKDVVNALKIPLPPLEKQNQIAEHISKIRAQAKQLQTEAKTGLEQAKKEVEAIILGDKL